MHAVSSYRGNRPTKTHTHTHTNTRRPPQTGPIIIHCTAKLSARWNQCKHSTRSTIAQPSDCTPGNKRVELSSVSQLEVHPGTRTTPSEWRWTSPVAFVFDALHTILVTVSYSATSHRRQSDAHHYPTSFLRIHTLYTKGLQALRLVFIRWHMSLRLRVVLRIARAITTENGKVRFTIFWATTRSAPLSCRYSLTSRTRRKVHLHRHRGRSAFEPFVRLEIHFWEVLQKVE